MAEQLDRVAAVFKRFDTDGSGNMSKKDLVAVMNMLGVQKGTSDKVVESIMMGLNEDAQGNVKYIDFLSEIFSEEGPLVEGILDYLDQHEDLATLSLSRLNSGEGFPKELVRSQSKANATGSADTTPAADSGAIRGHQDPASASRVPAADRDAVCKALVAARFMSYKHPLFMHGRAYNGPEGAPKKTWACDKPPRDDHDAPEWLTASEFQDTPAVQAAKVRQLASLMRLSKKTVAYTGAGISASVVGQAARSGTNTQGWVSKQHARPTFTHFALGLLGQKGLINSWVQQNHDGLPQKAGFPQECINEIHGSWYDPCNPVVKYCGSLHDRAFPWMENDAETADLVLVLGTSLGGLNADQVATNSAERSLRPNGSLGTVCINLQQTDQDGKMTLRCFAKSDDLLGQLVQELGFSLAHCRAPVWSEVSCVLVPYDAEGKRLSGSGAKRMWLDMRRGSRIRLASDHNIQGAKQPQFMHIGAKKEVSYKGVTRKPGPGNGTVTQRDEATSCFLLEVEGVQMRLGIWWLEAAMRGGPERLPIINETPVFESEEPRDFKIPCAAPATSTAAANTTAPPKPKTKAKAKGKSRSPSPPPSNPSKRS